MKEKQAGMWREGGACGKNKSVKHLGEKARDALLFTSCFVHYSVNLRNGLNKSLFIISH